MKWYGISGSWRKINERVRLDVEKTVEEIIQSGDGILTGGALGVDYITTDTVLHSGKTENRLRIFLPTKFDTYMNYMGERAEDGTITYDQFNLLFSQLDLVRRLSQDCILEGDFNEVNRESYYARNSKIIENCDGLYAFQINESKGVQDAINKARNLGKPVYLRRYFLD